MVWWVESKLHLLVDLVEGSSSNYRLTGVAVSFR